jgi:hypothetical protein
MIAYYNMGHTGLGDLIDRIADLCLRCFLLEHDDEVCRT